MIIFHSLPRAARTTLSAMFVEALRDRKRYQVYEPMRILSGAPAAGELPIQFEPIAPLPRVDPWKLRNIEFVFGFFSERKIEKRDGDFLFTFLRHPVDRFYSGYFYAHFRVNNPRPDSRFGLPKVDYRRRFPEAAALLDLDQKTFVDHFLDRRGELVFHRGEHLSYRLIEEAFFLPKQLDRYDFIGIMEKMDESLALLGERLGVPLRLGPRLNAGPPPEPRCREDDIRALYADEIEIYEHYSSALQSRG
jgi:hypothetical protein